MPVREWAHGHPRARDRVRSVRRGDEQPQRRARTARHERCRRLRATRHRRAARHVRGGGRGARGGRRRALPRRRHRAGAGRGARRDHAGARRHQPGRRAHPRQRRRPADRRADRGRRPRRALHRPARQEHGRGDPGGRRASQRVAVGRQLRVQPLAYVLGGIAERRPGLRAGFVHVPATPDLVPPGSSTPTLRLDELERGIRVAIVTAATTPHDARAAEGSIH